MRKEEVAQEHVFKVSLPEVRQIEHPTSSESPCPLPSTVPGIHGHHRINGIKRHHALFRWNVLNSPFRIPATTPRFLNQPLFFSWRCIFSFPSAPLECGAWRHPKAPGTVWAEPVRGEDRLSSFQVWWDCQREHQPDPFWMFFSKEASGGASQARVPRQAVSTSQFSPCPRD